MARGSNPLPIVIQSAGLVANVPPHIAPPNSIIAGQNIFKDTNGLITARPGYQPYSLGSVSVPGSLRLHGGVGFQDANGAFQYVVASNTKWFAFVSSAWTDITDLANPNSGASTDPARFAVFYRGGIAHAIGVDNFSQPREWDGSLATYATLAAAFPARDIDVLANRVVIVNTTEAATRFPRRVRWSAVNDETTWPALGFIDIFDADDPIVGIATIAPNLAVIYGTKSFFFLQAQAGDDSSAFSVSRVPMTEGFVGPCSPAAIARAEGLHGYLGLDGRIYSFDGVTLTNRSDAAGQTFTSAFDSANASRAHASYQPDKRLVHFFMPTTTLTTILNEPSVSQTIDMHDGSVLPPQTFSEGITMSFTSQNNTGVTWTNAPGTWTTIPYTWDNAPFGLETDVFLGTASGEVDVYFHGSTDGHSAFPIPWSFTLAPFWAQDNQNQIKLSKAEFYFLPTGTAETATVTLNTLNYPVDPGTLLQTISCGPGWTTLTLTPGPSSPQNINNNLIQLIVSSVASQGALDFVGGCLWVDYDLKPDYALATQ